MKNANSLIGNPKNDNSKFCFAKANDLYVVYLPSGGTTDLDLASQTGPFQLSWFNPRTGGNLERGGVRQINGPGKVALGNPPREADQDWVALVRRD